MSKSVCPLQTNYKNKLTPPTIATGIVLIMAANLGIKLSKAAYTATSLTTLGS